VFPIRDLNSNLISRVSLSPKKNRYSGYHDHNGGNESEPEPTRQLRGDEPGFVVRAHSFPVHQDDND